MCFYILSNILVLSTAADRISIQRSNLLLPTICINISALLPWSSLLQTFKSDSVPLGPPPAGPLVIGLTRRYLGIESQCA